MKVDLTFEVVEVGFDQFERRKAPRGNISVVKVQNELYFESILNNQAEATSAFRLAIDVNEVPFDQFERRQHSR